LQAAVMEFAAGVVPQISNVEIGFALISIGAGLAGLDLKPAGAIALLRRIADTLEAAQPGPPTTN
jgi:hypothetical protein